MRKIRQRFTIELIGKADKLKGEVSSTDEISTVLEENHE
jgi:hypothetical protein